MGVLVRFALDLYLASAVYQGREGCLDAAVRPEGAGEMSAVPRQLVLDLAHRLALGAEDFLVSRSNAAAVDLVDRWPAWPHWAALVVGSAGSGKTHSRTSGS